MKVEGLILVEGNRRCEIAVEPFDASVPWAEDRVVRRQALSVSLSGCRYKSTKALGGAARKSEAERCGMGPTCEQENRGRRSLSSVGKVGRGSEQ